MSINLFCTPYIGHFLLYNICNNQDDWLYGFRITYAQRIVPLLLTTVLIGDKQTKTESKLKVAALFGNLSETKRLLEADKDILQNMEKV